MYHHVKGSPQGRNWPIGASYVISLIIWEISELPQMRRCSVRRQPSKAIEAAEAIGRSKICLSVPDAIGWVIWERSSEQQNY